MKSFSAAVVAALSLTISFAAYAQSQPKPPVEGSIALGYVGTTGNTDTTTFNTEMLVTVRYADWTHNGKFQALGSQKNSSTEAERYFLEDKSDYSLDLDRYLFVKGSYLDDRFSGYNYQTTAAAGYGRYLINRSGLSLQAFGGVGYRRSEDFLKVHSDDAIITVGEKLAWQLSGNAKLVQNFTSDIGGGLASSVFEVALESQIIGRVTTKIAFQARNISRVPAGKKATDTQTSVSLAYSF